MAKLIGPLHSTEARGRVDALVYNTWRGIRYVKRHTDPVHYHDGAQEDQRARVSAANLAWQQLTNSQRRQWDHYALQHPGIDWTGAPIRRTGHNMFVAQHIRLSRAGWAPLTDPDYSSWPYPLTSLAVSQTGNNARLAWTYPTQPTGHDYEVQIWRHGPISVGRIPDLHHAILIAHALINASPYDDPLTLTGRYGYWLRPLDDYTGEVAPWLRDQLDFTYTPPGPPTGGVTGRLLTDSFPVPNVQVTIDGYTPRSGDDGVFLQTGIPHGDYTVTPDPTAGPWTPESKPAHVDPPATTDVGDFLYIP